MVSIHIFIFVMLCYVKQKSYRLDWGVAQDSKDLTHLSNTFFIMPIIWIFQEMMDISLLLMIWL